MGSPKRKGASSKKASTSIKTEDSSDVTSATPSGVYNLTESGLEYEHVKSPPKPPKDSNEFLERFR